MRSGPVFPRGRRGSVSVLAGTAVTTTLVANAGGQMVAEPFPVAHAVEPAGDDAIVIGCETHDSQVGLDAAGFVEQRGVHDVLGRYVHLRDARAVKGREHWLPVLAGRGAISFTEAVNALRRLTYEGYVSFEWEKYWHPEIEEPEVALPDFVEAMKAIFQSNKADERINAA